jgi:hypothetical protein
MERTLKITIVFIMIASLAFATDCFKTFYYNFAYYNATEFGLSTENTGEENSKALQELIDSLPENETIYISAGEYKFAKTGNQTIGSYCIKMRSNINIIGDGELTVLLPVGHSKYGLDMFYFNELLDSGSATYLE